MWRWWGHPGCSLMGANSSVGWQYSSLHEQDFVLSDRWDTVLTDDLTGPEAVQPTRASTNTHTHSRIYSQTHADTVLLIALSSAQMSPVQLVLVYHNPGVHVSVFVFAHEWLCRCFYMPLLSKLQRPLKRKFRAADLKYTGIEQQWLRHAVPPPSSRETVRHRG